MARRKWTKELVVSRIRQLQSKGMLRPGYLTQEHGGLYSAGAKLFGSSDAMYRAAGIDPSMLGVRRKKSWKWTKESVVLTLRELRSKGEDIRPRHLHKKHSGLLDAGERFFGDSRAMYQAAGIDETELGLTLGWSKEKVVAHILERAKSGRDMNYTATRGEDRKLAVAAKRHFGGWYNALRAAGIEPDKYQRKRPNRYWSKDKILDAIKAMHKAGKDMSQPAAQSDDHSLVSAAAVKFGSWYPALEAAGIHADEFRKMKPMGYWTRVRILGEIRGMYEGGETLNYLNAKEKHTYLFNAAVREFGSWYPAVEAAGIASAGFRRFRPIGYWSKEEVVREVNRLKMVDDDLSLVSVRETNGALYNGARKIFGSWKKALESAGYDYTTIRKDMMLESFEGTVFEVYVREALRVLGWNVRYHKHFRFGNETCVPDFYDVNSGLWIDAKLNCSGHGVRSRIERYLQYTDKVMVIYLKGRVQKWRGETVEFTPVGRLYPKLREKGAVELVRNLEMLRHGVTKPELQSQIVGFVSRVSPESINMVTTQLEKIEKL